jgi:hypothetical protein
VYDLKNNDSERLEKLRKRIDRRKKAHRRTSRVIKSRWLM